MDCFDCLQYRVGNPTMLVRRIAPAVLLLLHGIQEKFADDVCRIGLFLCVLVCNDLRQWRHVQQFMS